MKCPKCDIELVVGIIERNKNTKKYEKINCVKCPQCNYKWDDDDEAFAKLKETWWDKDAIDEDSNYDKFIKKSIKIKK